MKWDPEELEWLEENKNLIEDTIAGKETMRNFVDKGAILSYTFIQKLILSINYLIAPDSFILTFSNGYMRLTNTKGLDDIFAGSFLVHIPTGDPKTGETFLRMFKEFQPDIYNSISDILEKAVNLAEVRR